MVEQGFSKVIKILALITLAVVIIITTAGVFLFENHQQNNSKKEQFLASIYGNKEQYDDVFSKLQKPAENVNAKAGIISHHFLAKQLIADFYNTVGNDKISTVFLVSPDHFNNYFKPEIIAYTSYLNWTTPFGQLSADKEAIGSLSKLSSIETGNSILGLEHGIYVEVPFIKKFFPNAKIVPLVLRNNLPADNFLSLGKELKKIAGDNSILIVSSDFSHNSTIEQARASDQKSIDALNNLNIDKISQVTSDCKQCLAVLTEFLDINQDSFSFIDNKNSFDISFEDKDSVTSYVSGYYSKKEYARILFAGDLMFDRGIRYYAEKNGGNDFIFEKITPLLLENDLVVANLEGSITSNKSVSAGTAPGSANNYFLTFDPSVAKTLFEKNIKLVSLGNNHILNFGREGLSQTQKYLEQANVDYFGAPGGIRSIIENINGIKVGFISYNEFASSDIDGEQEATINAIKKIKPQADIVIVFSHWGVEYSLIPVDSQKVLAHQFVDAGADLIIGSHPHVIEPMEEYNGKRIYYSLGNFIFDQYFEETVRNGLGVELKINRQTKQLEFTEKHLYLQSGGQTIIKDEILSK